jgi:hypothetical protein
VLRPPCLNEPMVGDVRYEVRLAPPTGSAAGSGALRWSGRATRTAPTFFVPFVPEPGATYELDVWQEGSGRPSPWPSVPFSDKDLERGKIVYQQWSETFEVDEATWQETASDWCARNGDTPVWIKVASTAGGIALLVGLLWIGAAIVRRLSAGDAALDAAHRPVERKVT